MVRGLEHFRDWFSQFTDHYVLIGGTACDLILDEAGLPFRATKDLDIVVMVDIMDSEFARRFWDYIDQGGYRRKQRSSGRPRAYRFDQPTNQQFPHMIELFARKPEELETDYYHTGIIPLPVDDSELSSLSAILLDDHYFNFLRTGIIDISGIPIIDAAHLIVLKAQAWIDLKSRKESGETIDSIQIRKHRNDIFRLFPILEPEQSLTIPDKIKDDLIQVLSMLRNESIPMRDMGINTMSQDEVISELETRFMLRDQ